MPVKPAYEELEQRVKKLENEAFESRQTEEAWRESEKNYRMLFREMISGFTRNEIICDSEGRPINSRYLDINPAFERIVGLKAEDVVGKTILEVFPSLEPYWMETFGRVALTGEPEHFEDIAAETGIWFEVMAFRPAPNQYACTFTDITERKRAEEALGESEALLSMAGRTARFGGWSAHPDGHEVVWSEQVALIHEKQPGYSPTVEEAIQYYAPEWRDKIAAVFQVCTREGIPWDEEMEIITAGGHRLWVRTTGEAVRDNTGKIVRVQGSFQDITERKQTEEERQKFAMVAESSSEFIGMCDLDMNPVYVNPAGRRMVGLPDMATACRVKVQDYYFPEDQRFIAEEFFPRVMREGHGDVEIRLRHFQTGEPIWMFYYLFRVHDAGGTPVGWATVSRDITERKVAEKEKEKLQGQLIQAQKMESVGRLAGGVAHDYNNALSVIIGFTEMAMEDVDPSGKMHANLAEVLSAAKRSTNITRQLLAFARQQTIAPKVLDLNDTIENMVKMVQRLIGEDIDFTWIPGGELWTVKIDPTQVDQILANLCVNARDAISDVGKVTIETKNMSFDESYCVDHAGFVPGDYVMLAVSDDGSGMTAEVLDKIFEPFFTTKALHQGTGLGLATVYGIVKQNNALINVYSELEKGTTIKIYLPRHTGQTIEAHRETTVEIPLSRGETVLIVEDDRSILELGKRILEDLGYTVLSTNSPHEAPKLAEAFDGEINLLLTDVVMPGMNGRELSDQIKARYPTLKTLFMSGYTANVIAHRGVLEESVCFMSKPFSKKDLAVKVRGALDNDNT
jgi:PAS domain S-box-containing protein